ncbi:MAG: hypothetical protein JW761_00395, partial [Prolixibacteraceae bacterium]|nr:hypothetical protein [Prolixibacteraceae bacterium]
MNMYFQPGKFRKALPKASTRLKNRSFKILPVLFLIHFYGMVSAQDNNDAATRFFRGTATLTTKGLSTFPNLTLGKPAAIFDLSMGG